MKQATANQTADVEARRQSQRNDAAGLCMTCDHAASCMYLAGAVTPVWQCEEFDDGAPGVRVTRSVPIAVPAPGAVEAQPAAEAPVVLGICSNCDHLAGCTLPRSLGGVWHCEEYL